MKRTHERAGVRAAWPSDWWAVAAAIALAIALFQPHAARAAVYKWVDDKGVVHYSDRVPPEAVNKGNVQLGSQGIPIKRVDPAIAPEQRKARESESEQQREAAKQRDAAARRDRALLDSYTSESDIDLARSRAVHTLQAALDSAQGYSTLLTKRKVALNQRKAAYVGKAVPADIENELAAVDAELERQGAVIAQKNKQLVEVAAKYDAEKERWHAIKNSEATQPPPAQGAAAVPAPPPAPTPSPPPAPRK